jgi:hypothetical protein
MSPRMSSEPGSESKAAGKEVSDLCRLEVTLRQWQSKPWPEVTLAAWGAGTTLKSRLVCQDLWDKLRHADQAAVHWMMATGWRLKDRAEAREGDEEIFKEMADVVGHVAFLCRERNYSSRRHSDVDQAQEVWGRLNRLPYGWRAEVVRRVLPSLTALVGDAQICLNILENVQGVDVRQG